MRAGKHVLVEEPVADRIEHLEDMRREAGKRGLVCMPVHNYIYLPDIIGMKRSIDEGRLGDVAVSWIMFHIHHPEETVAKFPGIIRQISTHLLYIYSTSRKH